MKTTNKSIAEERALLDRLLSESKLYHTSQDFMELLGFIVQMRNMAPFNAMLLQIQKPGLSYAASAHDWRERFDRKIKLGARPLLIMWPFGPVALVYDIQDTEGEELPVDAFAFYCAGNIDDCRIAEFQTLLARRKVDIEWLDRGDNAAGWIKKRGRPEEDNGYSPYAIGLNNNHSPAITFCTLVHELAHLFLGHLGDDFKLKIKQRVRDPDTCEIEAESVAYLVCNRNGLEPRSQSYLNKFVENDTTTETIDFYAITRSAGSIERFLGLSKSMQLS